MRSLHKDNHTVTAPSPRAGHRRAGTARCGCPPGCCPAGIRPGHHIAGIGPGHRLAGARPGCRAARSRRAHLANARSARRGGGRPAHPDAEAGRGARDLDVVGQALDDGQAELGGHRLPGGFARRAGRSSPSASLPPFAPAPGPAASAAPLCCTAVSVTTTSNRPSAAGQRDPDRLGRAMLLMRLDRPRARLPDRQADLVEKRLVHAAAPGHRGGYQPRRAHMRRQRRKTHLNCGHRRQSACDAATSRTSWPRSPRPRCRGCRKPWSAP